MKPKAPHSGKTTSLGIGKHAYSIAIAKRIAISPYLSIKLNNKSTLFRLNSFYSKNNKICILLFQLLITYVIINICPTTSAG